MSGAGTHMATQLICVIYSPAPRPDPSSLGLRLQTPCLSPRETGPPDKGSQKRALSTAAGVSLPGGHANSSRRATSWLPFTLHLQGHSGRKQGTGRGEETPKPARGLAGRALQMGSGKEPKAGVALDHAGGPRVSSGSDERRAGPQRQRADADAEMEGARPRGPGAEEDGKEGNSPPWSPRRNAVCRHLGLSP